MLVAYPESFMRKIFFPLSVFLISLIPTAVRVEAATFYVSESATGQNNGTSWTDAYDDLQTILQSISPAGDEIWVAEGVYVPGSSPGDTFDLPSDTSIYGGFPGNPGQEGLFDIRDPFAFPSILSGDILGDDLDPNGDSIADSTSEIQGTNCFHVVTAVGVNNSTVLDGFFITAGQANGGGIDGNGGGMVISTADPILRNLVFSGNMAMNGGGAIDVSNSVQTMMADIEFFGNWAGGVGGAMRVTMANLNVMRGLFLQNAATDGGAIHSTAQMSDPSMGLYLDIHFLGNRSANSGGAYHGTFSNDEFVNVVYSGNTSVENGGAIFAQDSRLRMINSTVANNFAGENGGGIRGDTERSFIFNSILWGNRDTDFLGLTEQLSGTFDVVDTLIEGGCLGNATCIGNSFSADPQFIDADGTDNTFGTFDDNLEIGPSSPAIDSGSLQHLPVDVTQDIIGATRVVNGKVDQGAYEAQEVLLQKPANVRAAGAEGSVRIVWDSNPESYLAGYNIYRSTSPFFVPTNQIRLNLDGVLLDPTFVDTSLPPLPPSTPLYYQVEAVAATQGIQLTARSESAEATLGEYVLYLPAIRASTLETPSRYPISILNARGLIESGLELVLMYPDIVENVSFERTALSEDFLNITAEVFPASGHIRIFDGSFKGIPSPGVLNGEGSLFNLTFDVKDSIPQGTVGSFVLDGTASQVQTAGGTFSSPRVIGPGLIELHDKYRLGDLNGDGIASASDVVFAASFALGVPFTDLELMAGDINADGLIDIADLNLIRSRAGLKKSNGGEGSPAKGGVPGTFQVQLVDNSFMMLPGTVQMAVSMTPPMGEPGLMAGAAMTIDYASDLVELDGVQLSGSTFDDLFYDQRDYSRHFSEGRVRVIVSSPTDKMVGGEVLKLNLKSKGTPMASETLLQPKTIKLSKSNGSDEDWEFVIQPVDGTLFFTTPSPTATLTFTETPTPTETSTSTPPMSTATFTPTATGTSTPTETATSTPTETETETSTPTTSRTLTATPTTTATGTIDLDFCPDGKIDVNDLLKYLEAFREQHLED